MKFDQWTHQSFRYSKPFRVLLWNIQLHELTWKPNIFEIYKDGELLNQNAAKKDYQQHLEENILGINYKSFNQIVVLGSATYVPFMELRVGQRREIIEDLLDIQVFSVMNLLAKDKINEKSNFNKKY